jgi:hypothetical protein
MMNHMQYGQ